MYDNNFAAQNQNQMQNVYDPEKEFGKQQQNYNEQFYNSSLLQENHQQNYNGLFPTLRNYKFVNLYKSSC